MSQRNLSGIISIIGRLRIGVLLHCCRDSPSRGCRGWWCYPGNLQSSLVRRHARVHATRWQVTGGGLASSRCARTKTRRRDKDLCKKVQTCRCSDDSDASQVKLTFDVLSVSAALEPLCNSRLRSQGGVWLFAPTFSANRLNTILSDSS